MLPEFSVEISDRNSGNTYKIKISIFKKWKAFSLNFEIVAGIYVRNFDRKFRQHNGNPLGPKCSDPRFGEILYNIRGDTAHQKCIKMGLWHAHFPQSQCILQNTAQNAIITASEHVILLWWQL